MPPPERAARQPGDGVEDSSGCTWLYRAYGLTWRSEFPWPVPATSADVEPDVELRLCESVDALWGGDGGNPDWLFRIDGRRFVIQRGKAGDFRLVQQRGARFHLNSSSNVISCEQQAVSDPESQRLLLDTVLWTTMLLQGLEALHASAVETPYGVIAFLAESGSGKTSLAFELVRRGHPLFCDDILTLERRDGGFLAHPAPPLMNLPVAAISPLVGNLVANLGDENWVTVANAGQQPSRLAHVFLLDRAHRVCNRVVPMEPTALDLLPHARVHAFSDAWQLRRFELCSDVALDVPVSRLEVDLETSPSGVADLVENAIASADAP